MYDWNGIMTNTEPQKLGEEYLENPTLENLKAMAERENVTRCGMARLLEAHGCRGKIQKPYGTGIYEAEDGEPTKEKKEAPEAEAAEAEETKEERKTDGGILIDRAEAEAITDALTAKMSEIAREIDRLTEKTVCLLDKHEKMKKIVEKIGGGEKCHREMN